jgi:hypothetical protein
MPIDVAAMQSAHRRFMTEHTRMVGHVLSGAQSAVLAEVNHNPGFTPRTGALQRATKARIVVTSRGKILRVSNAKKYARPIEEGSRPHRIVARKAKFLRFIGRDGAVVFRRSVNHPGNRAHWFLNRAQITAAARMKAQLEAGMRRVSAITY